MRTPAFRQWLAQLSQLTPQQMAQLSQQLPAFHEVAKSPLSVGDDSAIPIPTHCPHCQAAQLRSWGSSHGLPRYRCKACGKTFNPLTGTALARLRKREQWQRYAETLIQSLSVRAAAKQCGVDKNTAFLWRHRFLLHAASHRAQHESGIVEADETFFLKSCKGQRHLPRPARHRGGVANKRGLSAEQVPVLVVRDRSGRTADFLLEKLDALHEMAALQPLVDHDAILCTDSAGVYAAYARTCGITHHPINIQQGRRVDGAFHIQNVNAYDSRLKSWMRRFHGVATKYLANYLGWRRMLERYHASINPLFCLREAIGRPILQQLIQT